MKDLWAYVLTTIEKEVSRGNFLTLFKPTTLASLEDNIATITAPSPMLIDLLQKRFGARIKELLDEKTKQDISLLFLVKSQPTQKTEETAPLFTTQTPQTSKPITLGHLPRVRQDFTFQSFAVSGSNQLAWVSASTVANALGKSYNPFFIYGPVGVGKTHLMHAIANHVYQHTPDKKIIYLTSEEFTNEVIEAIRTNETAKMKRRFRTASLLLIDDIQFIEGKERVQEELFHTFNILIDQSSQIALTSDRPPEEIKRLEKRLSSRFAGGLTVDIEAPDFELKTAILQKKAEKFGVDLPIEAAKMLADKAQDTRSLEGLLLRVMTTATLTNQPVSAETVLRALGKQREETHTLHADDVIKSVCDFYQIKPTLLKSPKRAAALVKARQIAMYLLKKELGMTFVEIGNVLGGRDHTTVMHGVDKVTELVDNKARITVDISGITKAFPV